MEMKMLQVQQCDCCQEFFCFDCIEIISTKNDKKVDNKENESLAFTCSEQEQDIDFYMCSACLIKNDPFYEEEKVLTLKKESFLLEGK